MPTYSSYNSLGSSIEAGEITAGAIQNTHMGFGVWEQIDTVTVSTASTITFSSIATGYKNFLLVISVRSSNATSLDTMTIELNGDTTATNYYMSRTEFVGSTVTGSSGNTNVSSAQISADSNTAGTFTSGHYIISNDTTTNHQITGIIGAENRTCNSVTQWANTAEITSIKLSAVLGTTFVTNSRAVLYGQTD